MGRTQLCRVGECIRWPITEFLLIFCICGMRWKGRKKKGEEKDDGLRNEVPEECAAASNPVISGGTLPNEV